MMRGYEKQRLEINLARYKKAGMKFEIVIDPKKAWEYKTGKLLDMKEAVKDIYIYSDAQKGEKASDNDLKKVFGTTERKEIMNKMLREGELQLTAEIKSKMRDEKRKQIVNLIRRNGIDPRTKAVHPLERIESAMEEAKVRIDEFRPAEDQVNEVIKQISPIIPISIEKARLDVELSLAHASKCYSVIKQMATIVKENWLPDGGWKGRIELPAGMEADLYDKLNRITHGDIRVEKVN